MPNSTQIDLAFNSEAKVFSFDEMLTHFGLRGDGKPYATGVVTKEIVFGEKLLKLLNFKQHDGITLPDFKIVENEYLDEPVDISGFEKLGEFESAHSTFTVSRLNDTFAIVANNGVYDLMRYY